tara:strand:- start:16693 stop:16938 length:246 start_codon:yes stop_codon:yes gene_type:complete
LASRRPSISADNDGEGAMSTKMTPAVLTINEFSEWAKTGKTKIYEEIGSGALRAIKIGRRTLIPMDAALSWLNAQPTVGGR